MDEATRETISYYDENAKRFVADTAGARMGELQSKFASMLPKGGRILDLGCGSGRDSLAFLKAGFKVDAMDGSAAMCRAAHALTSLPVAHATFEDYEPQGPYDGIWACSSLLHVPSAKLPAIIGKYAGALKSGGTFYLSFKYGTFEGMRHGRWFTDMDEELLRSLVAHVEGLRLNEIEVTADVRPGRAGEIWANAWSEFESDVRSYS